MLATVLRHELRLLLRDRSAAIVAGVLVLSAIGAIYAGRVDVIAREHMAAQVVADEERTFGAFREAVRATDQLPAGSSGFDASTNPAILSMFYPRPAVLPPAPLAALSVGQRDVYPSLYMVTGERKDSFLDAVELNNPLHVLAGAFDISFIVVFMLPLFLLVLGHDLLSRERESGTLAQVMAHPVQLRTLVGGKLLARSAVVWVLISVTLVGLVVSGQLPTGDAWARFALWCAVVLGYSAVWLGLAALVDAWIGRSAASMVAASGVWLLLALVGPAVLHLAVSRAAPVPSRSEQIVTMREVETAARRPVELLEAYYREHPDRYPAHPDFDLTVYDFPLYWAAVQREVDRQLEPTVRGYEEALDAQERLARLARPVMPAALAVEMLNDVSGSGLRRYLRFNAQVLNFHDEHRAYYEPFIFSRTPLTRDDYGAMPRFQFVEERTRDVARRVAGGLMALAVVAGAVGAGAAAGYRRQGRSVY